MPAGGRGWRRAGFAKLGMLPVRIWGLTLPQGEGPSWSVEGTLPNPADYLDWRTKSGFTDTFEAMLTQPFVIHYYDEMYFGAGIAARE